MQSQSMIMRNPKPLLILVLNKFHLESLEARWVSIEDLLKLKDQLPGWRGPELYDWASYIESGGSIFPLSILDQEGAKISYEKSFTV